MNDIDKVEKAKEILYSLNMDENDTYFMITKDNQILSLEFTFAGIDIDNILSGNFYKNIEDAENKG